MNFLLENRNRVQQYNYPRRGGGYTAAQITLHTYEAPHTRSLLAAATWLTQRADYGSYHALAGDGSPTDVLRLVPWSYEAYHSTPNNNWSIGISAVTYASQWRSIPTRSRDNLVKSMAYAAANAAKWLQEVHGRTVEPRVLTRAQAMRKESGFVTHAAMDPGRRSDPGRDFPMDDFLKHFNALMQGSTERTWFDMASLDEVEQLLQNYTTVTLNSAQQTALATGRSTWALRELLGTLAHRIGYTNQRTYDAARGANEPTVRAIGKLINASEDTILAAISQANAETTTPDELPDEEN